MPRTRDPARRRTRLLGGQTRGHVTTRPRHRSAPRGDGWSVLRSGNTKPRSRAAARSSLTWHGLGGARREKTREAMGRPRFRDRSGRRAYSRRDFAAYREAHRFVPEHANIERDRDRGGLRPPTTVRARSRMAPTSSLEVGGRSTSSSPTTPSIAPTKGIPSRRKGRCASLLAPQPEAGVEIGRFGLGFSPFWRSRPVPRSSASPARSPSTPSTPPSASARSSPGRNGRPSPDRLLDRPAGAAAEDETLTEFMSWATTIIRLPATRPTAPGCPKTSTEFPASSSSSRPTSPS